jgi:hypothetical protein
MSGTDIGALAVLLIFGGPVAAFVIMRVLAHRERLEMIRHGMMPPSGTFSDRQNRRWVRDNPGMAPPPQAAPYAAGFTPNFTDMETPERSLQKGIKIGLVGLAIFLGLSWGLGQGPWLLGGLIPMFIGIAQIIIAILSGAQIVMPRGFGPTNMPPPAYPGSKAQPGAKPQPHVYQPGPEPPIHTGFEELTRPVPPPDRR